MNDIVERINIAYQLLLKNGIISSKKDMANKMNYNYTNITSALKGSRKYLTDSFIKEFNKTFGYLFCDLWLLTGEGDMLSKGDETKESIDVTGNSNIVVGRDNNGHISTAECQDQLKDALLKIKHLQERLKDKEEMIEILKSQLNK